ncbi:tRNA1(Val) (adenine(37)-N6)-methyltransferase [Pedobacter deserti]|uniref:tRNA1(Val) (adenine(37)-N6)-methyltransferase n=1 Tax=Pedobacter deserti TaxID=2817382 RepID=UPI00210AECC2|nr:methyltransferase [Pedobacter sp. SYSU D00382]
MKGVFRFKQFAVDQYGCAMKINTDGVLLGATAMQENAGAILDIGTGTGVIAMMLAQRFPDASVDAVEIDAQATQTAGLNFASSPFSTRLEAYHNDIASYETQTRYDLIVSNPPYFVDDLKNPEARKRVARHTDHSFFIALLQKASALLAPGGSMWLILPLKQAGFIKDQAPVYGLHLQRRIDISSDENKPVIRQIIVLGHRQEEVKTEHFYIYEREGFHTEAYRRLLKDFFLAF